jgi:hypothetical protein
MEVGAEAFLALADPLLTGAKDQQAAECGDR